MDSDPMRAGRASDNAPADAAISKGFGASVLILDDEPGMRSFLQRGLARHFALVESAADAAEAQELIGRCHFDLLIADIRLPGRTGIDWVRELREQGSSQDVIFITAHADLHTSIDAMRAGASDFILKPFRIEQLLAAVKRCAEHRKLHRENFLLQRETQQRFALEGVVGTCEPMNEVCRLINRVAPQRSTVLIQGESGTGKELVARAIHQRSGRPASFVAINCSAVSPELLESELFGHVKGAFTGAHQAREGLFGFAHGGTLFLDEIGDLAREFDAMMDLLRARNGQIREAADSLELKVDQRTAELKRRNEELERTVRLLRETRKQLVTAEKLASLGELTAGMAHEINNPLAVILGNLDVLTQELGDAAGPVRREIDLMVEQVYRVRDIIDNLLVNAIHALGESPGVIRLRSRDWERKGVVIGVSDSGIGIPVGLQGKVFSPFFTTKDVGAGTGLGLSISYGLIRRYGGNITLESEPGTALRVWLLAEPEIGDEDIALAEQLRLTGFRRDVA